MPGAYWCSYTSPADVAQDAATCLWWAEAGDREPLWDFLRRMARHAGSEESTGEPWFGYASEGEMGEDATKALSFGLDGDMSFALYFLGGFAEEVPAGFEVEDFIRDSARELGYWDELPEYLTDGYEEES